MAFNMLQRWRSLSAGAKRPADGEVLGYEQPRSPAGSPPDARRSNAGATTNLPNLGGFQRRVPPSGTLPTSEPGASSIGIFRLRAVNGALDSAGTA